MVPGMLVVLPLSSTACEALDASPMRLRARPVRERSRARPWTLAPLHSRRRWTVATWPRRHCTHAIVAATVHGRASAASYVPDIRGARAPVLCLLCCTTSVRTVCTSLRRTCALTTYTLLL